MKINIHTDQYIAPSGSKATRPASQPADAGAADQLSSSTAGAGVNTALDNLSTSRSVRVAQLAALYASGGYNVNSTLVAQALVSGAIA